MANPLVQKELKSKTLHRASLIAYTLVVLIATAVLITEPNGFNAQTMILPLIAALLLSSVGLAYKFASKATSGVLVIVGTIALAVFFAFIGFFFVAAIGWFVALSHAQ